MRVLVARPHRFRSAGAAHRGTLCLLSLLVLFPPRLASAAGLDANAVAARVGDERIYVG